MPNPAKFICWDEWWSREKGTTWTKHLFGNFVVVRAVASGEMGTPQNLLAGAIIAVRNHIECPLRLYARFK